MRLRRRLPALLLAALAACASAPQPDVELGPPVLDLAPADFPGAGAMLSGFDAPGGEAEWRAGDEVLFGLRLRHGGRDRHWLLRVELEQAEALDDAAEQGKTPAVLEPVTWPIKVNGESAQFRSRLCRVLVTVADRDGKVLARSHPLLPRDFLQHGFQPACSAVRKLLDDRPGLRHQAHFYALLDERLLAESVVCALALLQVVQGDEVLSPLLWEVVQRPSLLSLIGNFGANVVVQPRFQLTERASPPSAVPAGEAWRVPMRLFVNDTPGLDIELLVGRTVQPFALCGAILSAVARHPSERGREFTMLLLAARCGTEPATSQRSDASRRETRESR
jgi:hypothetical protein